jgi:hypothetical protein
MTIEELKKSWQEFLLFKDTSVIDIFLAVILSNLMHWESLNLMLIGPPGSGKTEMANFMDGHPSVEVVDSLTANSFISGFQDSKRNAGQVSLLNRMKKENKRILIFKDMSTVLALHNDVKREIMSQIRRISDGQLSKVVGNKMSFSWSGKLGFIAMATPAIDANIDVIRELGERWVYWRLEPQNMPSPDEIARKAQTTVGREFHLRNRISESTKKFLEGVIKGYRSRSDEEKAFNMESEWSEQIREVAVLTADLRKVVGRNPYTKELEYKPYSESPGRVTRYYTQLAICLSIINQKSMDDVINLVKRSAVYSLPELKVDVLRALYNPGNDQITTEGLSRRLNIPRRTTMNILEDYQLAGIVESTMIGDDVIWKLTDKIQKRIRNTGIFDLQKHSKAKTETEDDGW